MTFLRDPQEHGTALDRVAAFLHRVVDRISGEGEAALSGRIYEPKVALDIPIEVGTMQAAIYEALSGLGRTEERQTWPGTDEVDFTPLDPELVNARHPRSSPARLRPYNWQSAHAWPCEGWGDR